MELDLQLLRPQKDYTDDPCGAAAVCAPELSSTSQQTTREQSTNSSLLAMSKLFVRVDKYMGTIKQ